VVAGVADRSRTTAGPPDFTEIDSLFLTGIIQRSGSGCCDDLTVGIARWPAWGPTTAKGASDQRRTLTPAARGRPASVAQGHPPVQRPDAIQACRPSSTRDERRPTPLVSNRGNRPQNRERVRAMTNL
jgi:hypothetical protein